MNFTRLIKAMAVVGLVSCGSHAWAVGEDAVGGDDFDTANVGLFQPQAAGRGWTADAADLSMITNDYVTAFGAPTTEYPGFVDGDQTKLLALNTEGKDLTYAAETTPNADAYVDTLLKIVGSDTPPTINDATVQTAVYLDTNTGKLNAWLNDGEGAGEWVALTGVELDDGDWIHLQIKIDYITGVQAQTYQALATYKVNETTLYTLDGETQVTAQPILNDSKNKITSVAFRGTGMVDNFAVSETAQSLGQVTIIEQVVDADGNVLVNKATGDVNIGTSWNTADYSDSNDEDLQPLLAQGYLFVDLKLLDSGLSPITTYPGAVAEVATDALTNGQTYYVRATFTNKRSITFDANTGSGTMGAQTVTYNTAADLNANSFTKADYTFSGWNTAANGSGTAYANQGSITVTADTTLYAQWTINQYTITFNTDGGSAVDPITLDFGAAVTPPADPTKDGYTFTGWSPAVPATMPSGGLTVTAQWEVSAPAEDVTFDTEGANLEITGMSIAGDIITVTFTANGTVAASPATLWVKVAETLDGTPSYVAVEATVTAPAANELEGELTIDVSESEAASLFILGIRTDDPEAQI